MKDCFGLMDANSSPQMATLKQVTGLIPTRLITRIPSTHCLVHLRDHKYTLRDQTTFLTTDGSHQAFTEGETCEACDRQDKNRIVFSCASPETAKHSSNGFPQPALLITPRRIHAATALFFFSDNGIFPRENKFGAS